MNQLFDFDNLKSAVDEFNIVAVYKDEKQKQTHIIQKVNNGYKNYYDFNFKYQRADSNAGIFDTVEEARQAMQKHRPKAIEAPMWRSKSNE